MNIERLDQQIGNFLEEPIERADQYRGQVFVMSSNRQNYAPLEYLIGKVEGLRKVDDLLVSGHVWEAYYLCELPSFRKWFEGRFGRKLKSATAKGVSILYIPNNENILAAVEQVDKSYEILRREHILFNRKSLPIQLGEWYAKIIFGLRQMKSPSQRGFDFYWRDQRAEVKVNWGASSPKGVKIRRSLVELSAYCVIVYLSTNFMVREVCFLDSAFVLRRFAGKGHTIFLKDGDIFQYFFSRSLKHRDKVVNAKALLRYATPSFALKITEDFS